MYAHNENVSASSRGQVAVTQALLSVDARMRNSRAISSCTNDVMLTNWLRSDCV